MNERHRYFLCAIGIMSFAAMLLAACFAEQEWISQESALFFSIVCLCIGVFIIVAESEMAFAQTLADFGSAKVLLAVAFAAGAYFARKGGIGDVNNVFHIDPSALPMTLLAASVMYFVSSLQWIFAFIVLILVGKFFINYSREQWPSLILSGIGAAFSAIIFSFSYSHLHEQGRQEKIYRIAQGTDFNSTFRCKGVDADKFNVLFIGPDQRRVLIAPKIKERFSLSKPVAEILRPVDNKKISSVEECIPDLEKSTL